jgi:DNA replication protein DnaC
MQERAEDTGMQPIGASLRDFMEMVKAQNEKRQYILKTAKRESYTIESPDQCPFRGTVYADGCRECAKMLGIIQRIEQGDGEQCIVKQYDTIACYRNVRCRRILRESGLSELEMNHTFEAAKIDGHNAALYNRLQQWDPANKTGVFISADKDSGNPQGNGTGKSYALHALVDQLAKQGIRCKYARTVDFLQEIRSTYGEDNRASEVWVLGQYVNIPVLLFDDFGKERVSPTSEWATEKLYYVIDERVRRGRPMVISSNFSFEEIEQRLGNNHGPAIVSRLAGHCEYFKLGGPDRRVKG